MDKAKLIIAGVVLAILLVSAFSLGGWLRKPLIDDLIERNNKLAEQDSVRMVQIDSVTRVATRRAFLYDNEKELHSKLKKRNSNLLKFIEDQNGRIDVLVSAEARLEERLAGLGDVDRREGATTIGVNLVKEYDKNKVGVVGTVVLPDSSDAAELDLTIWADLFPTITVFENDVGEASVVLDLGIPSFNVIEIDASLNISQVVEEIGRKPLFDFSNLIKKPIITVAGISACALVGVASQAWEVAAACGGGFLVGYTLTF